MKHQIVSFLAAGAAVLLGTAACNNIKEKEFDPNDPAVLTITATPDAQSVIAEGGDLVYTFDAPGHWFGQIIENGLSSMSDIRMR